MDNAIAMRDVFYLVFGLAALVGTVYAVRTGNASRDGDERERIVRIDGNTERLRADVSDIKAEMRQTKGTISDHERRLVILETENATQWKRIDELRGGEEIKEV